MNRFSAKLFVATMASVALPAMSIAQTTPPQPATPPEAATPPATAPATDPSAQAPAAAATEAANVTDEQIRSFALAVVELDKIQRQYQPQLKAASAEQRAALEQEANAKMTAAVEAQGLEPETFNAISNAAQADAQLRAKISEELNEVRPATP